ncbi:MAG: hypothetical protein KDE26_27725 [Bacteroidetes bacterium]|nr:hypothetical protein [Bacteroidota bacterium]
MEKIQKHIVHFFLLLSLTFVFPVKYWHKCISWEDKHELHQVADQETSFTDYQTHCDLCDLIFPQVITSDSPILPVYSILKHWESMPFYQAPVPALQALFLLRAPPVLSSSYC